MINWVAVTEAGFRLPEGLSQQVALDELLAMLADPDPAVRDELAYTVLERLIPELDEAACLGLGDELAGRLAHPDLHVRSFAALVLAPVVKRGVFRAAWLAEFEAWYPRELDLRGWDPGLGWLHAAAHGAELLGAFGLHPSVVPGRMLNLAVERLRAPTDYVFAEMEDARLAHGIALTLTRPELPAAGSAGWLDDIEAYLSADQAEHVLPAFANMVRVLQALYVFADRGVHRSWDGGAVLTIAHKDTVKARIGEVLRSAMPYAALNGLTALAGSSRARWLGAHVVSDTGHDVTQLVQVAGGQRVEQQVADDLDVAGHNAPEEVESAARDGDQGGPVVVGAGGPGDEARFLQQPGLVGQAAAAVDDAVGQLGHGQLAAGGGEAGQQLELDVAEIALGAQLLLDTMLEQADGLHEREVGVQLGGIEPRDLSHPTTVPASNLDGNSMLGGRKGVNSDAFSSAWHGSSVETAHKTARCGSFQPGRTKWHVYPSG
jgi:hypothetical protein